MVSGRGFDSHRGQKIFSLPRVVPCFPLLGLTPSGLFMGLSSTIIYTSELILWFHYLCSQCYAAQHSYVPYINKLLTNLASLSRIGEYWPLVVVAQILLRSVRTAVTSGQYSPVQSSCLVSKRLLFFVGSLLASRVFPWAFKFFSLLNN